MARKGFPLSPLAALYEKILAMDAATHKRQVGWRLGVAIDVLKAKKQVASQAAVARQFGRSPQEVNNWIRGDHYPEAWFVYQFCSRYGVSADWIYLEKVSGMDGPLADGLWAARAAALAA